MKKRCPGLPNWEALKNCAALFATPDTAPKERYLSGPVSWGGHDAERIEALGLPFVALNAGTDASMFAKLKAAYDRQASILLWIYKPHWAPSVCAGEFAEFPKYEPAGYEDPAWGVNPNAAYDCGKPEGWIKKMAWAGGEAKWPCASEIVRNVTMDSDEVGRLIYGVDVEGRSVEDVAMDWARANEAKWRGWAACAETRALPPRLVAAARRRGRDGSRAHPRSSSPPAPLSSRGRSGRSGSSRFRTR